MNTHNKTTEPAAPLGIVWGAKGIATVLKLNERRAYHQLGKGGVPGARRIGGKWCLNVAVFERAFEVAA